MSRAENETFWHLRNHQATFMLRFSSPFSARTVNNKVALCERWWWETRTRVWLVLIISHIHDKPQSFAFCLPLFLLSLKNLSIFPWPSLCRRSVPFQLCYFPPCRFSRRARTPFIWRPPHGRYLSFVLCVGDEVAAKKMGGEHKHTMETRLKASTTDKQGLESVGR